MHTVSEQVRAQSLLSEWGRLTGILWRPRRVFDDLRSRPRWLAPILLKMGIAVAAYDYSLFQSGSILANYLASDLFVV